MSLSFQRLRPKKKEKGNSLNIQGICIFLLWISHYRVFRLWPSMAASVSVPHIWRDGSHNRHFFPANSTLTFYPPWILPLLTDAVFMLLCSLAFGFSTSAVNAAVTSCCGVIHWLPVVLLTTTVKGCCGGGGGLHWQCKLWAGMLAGLVQAVNSLVLLQNYRMAARQTVGNAGCAGTSCCRPGCLRAARWDWVNPGANKAMWHDNI